MYTKDDVSLLRLDEDSIHLWSIAPRSITDPFRLAYFKKIISTDELNKVAQYKNEKDKHNALVTRAFIRLILSRYVAISPKDWVFSKNEHGKPEIANSEVPLRFNLSHNKDFIICAICLDNDIGCDIESYNRKVNVSAISKRFYSKDEHQSINELSGNEQHTKFIQYWTLKEAFVKATGYGISLGLNTFSFRIGKSETPSENKNINLSISEKCKIDSRLQWFNCLIFPNNQYCIALSVNTRSMVCDFTIQQFSNDDLVHYF